MLPEVAGNSRLEPPKELNEGMSTTSIAINIDVP
jgi:hypothetical protein